MEVYEVKTDKGSTLFTSRQNAVNAIKLTFHKIASSIPNAMLSQCTIVFNDKSLENGKIYIEAREVYNEAEHL